MMRLCERSKLPALIAGRSLRGLGVRLVGSDQKTVNIMAKFLWWLLSYPVWPSGLF